MDTSVWPNLLLDDNVLREVPLDKNQIVFWIRGSLEGVYQNWDRVSSAAAQPVNEKGGLHFVRVTAMPARQKVRNIFGKPIQPLHKATGDHGWTLPDGTYAEQVGESQTDRTLVWAQNGGRIAVEVVERQFGSQGAVQRLGTNSFLVVPASKEMRSSPPPSEQEPLDAPKKSTDCQKIRDQANASLKAARVAANRRQEATALIDLGVVSLREGDLQQSVDVLQEALGIAAQIYDRDLESDALVNFGLALLAVGQAERAAQIFGQEIERAHAGDEIYREKIALDHLGAVHVKLGDIRGAIAKYEQALLLAQRSGDLQHQADLHWIMAIQNAELGERSKAVEMGRRAITIYDEIKDPNVAELRKALGQFAGDEVRVELAGTGEIPDVAGQGYYTGPISETNGGSPAPYEEKVNGPRLLWMAFSAAKSLANFVGKGIKTVDGLVYEERLQTCAGCRQHTGVRCKACGCFTSIKAWMPHEKCPLAKWPD